MKVINLQKLKICREMREKREEKSSQIGEKEGYQERKICTLQSKVPTEK